MLVRQVFDPKLAQYAYLVGCPRTGEAIVIDPERDVDRYFALAERHKLRLVAAADTHIHADYLTGLRELAERGVRVYASKEGGPDWQYEWLIGSSYDYRLLGDGDTFTVGNIAFKAIHTPGHTPEHVSYLVRDAGSGSQEYLAIASGDFVFVGDVGRPDLLETAAGAVGAMEPAARSLYKSIQEDFRVLPEFLQIWPAHGAGSACGKALGDVPVSTVGYELRNNPSIRAASDEPGFVRFILSGQPEPPPYFVRMKRDNRLGPPVLGSLPRVARLESRDLGKIAGRRDVAVLDTRKREAFFEGHLPGSILADLDYQFCTIAGSYVEEETPIFLIVDDDRLDEAVRSLIRIGLDRIEGYATLETLAEWRRAGGATVGTERIDMQALESHRLAGDALILDVRGKAEYDAGHVPGATNIAHTRLLVRLSELPKHMSIVVHCRSGARSAAAVSLLERYGYRATQVDDLFENYRETGTQAAAKA
jgi:hydroxyacylglutathione hydrolase